MSDKNIVETQSESTVESENTTDRCPVRARFRSWAVWLSILGAVGIILNAVGAFDKLGINNTAWDVIVNAIGSILVGFGILNNPTDSKCF